MKERAEEIFFVGCVSLIAVGCLVLMGGVIWVAVGCKYKCNCSSDRCCKSDSSCPSGSPCSCLSDANDWSEPSCEEEDITCDSLYPAALAMLISGAALLVCPGLFLCCAYIVYPAVNEQYKGLVGKFRQGRRPNLSQVELGAVEGRT